MRQTGIVAHVEEMKGACRLLVGKPARKRPLGRPRLRGNIILKGLYISATEEHDLYLSGSG
jgi:hypothetical protein